ncbi:TIR domain-containing protein [Micromonospora chalcea]
MGHVFLSYSNEDRPVAAKLAAHLQERGVPLWWDASLQVGENWVRKIVRALDDATAILVLISPRSLKSEWVRHEWSIGLANSRRIIPILISGARFTDLPPELADVVGVDLDSDYSGGLEKLVSALAELDKSTEPSPAEVVDVDKIVRDVTAKVLYRLGVESSETPTGTENRDDSLVFVIMSFLPEMEPVFEAIQVAALDVGLRAERVKDVPGDYRITDQMLSMIRRARLVVADLTHERPNVYFELGYARGLGKTVVTIAREGSAIHFDVRDWSYLRYFDSRPLEQDIRERFRFHVTQQT